VLRLERAAAQGESGSASVAVGASALPLYPYPEDTKGNNGHARDPAEYDFAGPQDRFPGRRQLSVFRGVTQTATAGIWKVDTGDGGTGERYATECEAAFAAYNLARAQSLDDLVISTNFPQPCPSFCRRL
jgi:hypothetical protein